MDMMSAASTPSSRRSALRCSAFQPGRWRRTARPSAPPSFGGTMVATASMISASNQSGTGSGALGVQSGSVRRAWSRSLPRRAHWGALSAPSRYRGSRRAKTVRTDRPLL